MLNLDTKMFLQSPDNSDNYLYPATIVEADSSNSLYSAVPDEEAEFGSEQSFSVETGQEILVYSSPVMAATTRAWSASLSPM